VTLSTRYDPLFFQQIANGSRNSAQTVVPLVLSWLKASSVVDVGCGEGSWLAEFRRHGIDDVRGLDGSYVPIDLAKIPNHLFTRCDLSRNFSLDRQFDLAISLETAEHLPESRAGGFVADLVSLAPQVLFSAAIPFQRGKHHVNCQWPDYWQALFLAHNYVAFDVIRPAVWEDENVEFWYRQNTILYVRRDKAERDAALRVLLGDEKRLKRLIHPVLADTWERHSLRELVALLPSTLGKAIGRKLSSRGARLV
jgi:SAM-dependent methyltransferase